MQYWTENSSETEHIRVSILCDFVNRYKEIVGKPSFPDQFKTITKCYNRAGYTTTIMRQSDQFKKITKCYNRAGYNMTFMRQSDQF